MPLPSGFEWIVILVIALLILGPGKLPDVASAVGKSIREFRKASTDVQEAVKIDTSPLPAGAAQPPPTPAPPVASAAAAVPPPAPAEPNVLQSSAQPNVLQGTPSAPTADADSSPTDAAPTANG